MRIIVVAALLGSLLIMVGCTVPQIIQPLRLYDLRDGNTIEVVLHQTSRDHGTITSSQNQKEQFTGEYMIYDGSPNWSGGPPSYQKGNTFEKPESPPADLAELYGFSKNSEARPVGTGVIVGKDGTVIEIVFYKVSPDLQTGDGVAKDNKGRYYRIFFSTVGS